MSEHCQDPHPIFVDRVPCGSLQSSDRCCVCFRADVSPHLLRLHPVHHEGRDYNVCQVCDLSAHVQELATCGAASTEASMLVEHRLRQLRTFLEEDFRIYRQRQLDGGQCRTSAAERGPDEAPPCNLREALGSIPSGPIRGSGEATEGVTSSSSGSWANGPASSNTSY